MPRSLGPSVRSGALAALAIAALCGQTAVRTLAANAPNLADARAADSGIQLARRHRAVGEKPEAPPRAKPLHC